MMKTLVVLMASFLMTVGMAVAGSRPKDDQAWQSKVTEILPLLGHRNWILIVDSAYPLQTSPAWKL